MKYDIDWDKLSKDIAKKKAELDLAKVEPEEKPIKKRIFKISLEDAIKIIAM